MTEARTRGAAPDLEVLTGVRSGKSSYYRAYRRSDERMERAVRAMDSISHALVRTVEGPRALLEEVVRAAAAHLEASWTILALADGELPGARPRFLAVAADGLAVTEQSQLPAGVRRELAAVRSGSSGSRRGGVRDVAAWVRVPMTLEGREIGTLASLHGLDPAPESADLSVLRILANHAAVSLHTSEQYQSGITLHRRAQRLYEEARAHERDLAQRTGELRDAEERLALARQRELIDTERHRIARELHDSVTQYVLSAGMAVEVARGEVEALGEPGAAVEARLATAKHLSQEAVTQLRRAIYALHRPANESMASLVDLLREVAVHHRPQLQVTVRLQGEAFALPPGADHEIARAVGEALFNVAMHADAERAVVRLRYRPEVITISVSDDGRGDPRTLNGLLRLERRASTDGNHRGLANIEGRIVDLGGSVSFRRSRMGGVRVEMRLPLPLVPPREPVGTAAGVL